MAIFAKIYSMYESQVLVTYEFDDRRKKYFVDIRTEILGCSEGMTLDFEARDDAENFFELYSEDQAREFYEGLIMELN